MYVLRIHSLNKIQLCHSVPEDNGNSLPIGHSYFTMEAAPKLIGMCTLKPWSKWKKNGLTISDVQGVFDMQPCSHLNSRVLPGIFV